MQVEGPRPDLSVQMGFSKNEYLPGEDLVLTIKVRNVGPIAANAVRFSVERDSLYIKSGYEDLVSRPNIAPGAELVMTIVAKPSHDLATQASASLRATIDGVADPTPADNAARSSTWIRIEQGSASGVVYFDANGNGKPDAGEGVTDHVVVVEGGHPKNSTGVWTDAQGGFSYYRLPVGEYNVLRLQGNPARYVVKPGTGRFVVEKDKNTVLAVEAVKASSELLGVNVQFDRDEYAKTGPVGINITLTNKSDAPMPGVVAVCNEYMNYDGQIDGTSPAWTELNPDGKGVTLAPRETRTIKINETVPAGSGGSVAISCNFGNNGRNTAGYVGGSDWARVTGINGNATGSVVNAETGQSIGAARIAVLDHATRKLIYVMSQSPQGGWYLGGVRAGKYVLVVTGPWHPKDGVEFTVDIVADQTVAVPALKVVPGPEVPDPSNARPDIAVTAAFDRNAYDVADLIRVKVKVENKGTAAGYARYYEENSSQENLLDYDKRQWGDLNSWTNSVLLQPGESREVEILGRTPWRATKTVAFNASFMTANDSDQSNNKVSLLADVHALTGNVEVLTYADKNLNGSYDADEQFKNVKVTLGGNMMPIEKFTDSAGKVQFADQRIGTYHTYAELPDGWVLPHGYSVEFAISADTTTVVELRAVRPLSDAFSASVNFVKDAYAPNENYELDITLTNRTGGDLPSVKAFCSGPGEPGEIYNGGPGWGALAWDGAGVPVKDGETRTWRVSGALPEEASRIGYATIGCNFGPDPSLPGVPGDGDQVRVPGQRADAIGKLLKDDPNGGWEGIPVPDMILVLVDHMSNEVVARTITDAEGRFKVFNLPVGRYDLVVPGPWKTEFRRMNPYFLVSVGGETREQDVYLVPGPEVEDPGYPQPGDRAPDTNVPPAQSGGGGGVEALAKTGASVLGLGVLGALLVAFGLGVGLIGRRQRTA